MVSYDPELRLVLLGRTGSGKTATQNTILGREERNQAVTSTSIQQSESKQGEVAGRKVTVVDTPDWFSPGLSLENLRQDVQRCVQLSAPGPHAFLLVIPVKHLEEKEIETGKELKRMNEILLKVEEIFGERCSSNIIILFTVTDECQKEKTESLIKSGCHEVQSIINKFDGRFHCLNIKENGDGSQVSELLKKIEKMYEPADNYYSSEIYFKTLSRISDIEKNIREKLEKLDDPAVELRRNIKEQKEKTAKRKRDQEQAEETKETVKKKKENDEMLMYNVQEANVSMEAVRNEMKTTLHEIWRSILTSTMKMQEELEKEKHVLSKKGQTN